MQTATEDNKHFQKMHTTIKFKDKIEILQNDITANIMGDGLDRTCNLEFDLDKYHFPDFARIQSSIQYKGRKITTEHGTVGKPYNSKPISLSSLPETNLYAISLSVYNPMNGIDKGRHFGVVFDVKFQACEDQTGRVKTLLPFNWVEMGNTPFRVSFDVGQTGFPTLEMNKLLGHPNDIVSDPSFLCYVLPSSIRTVLERIMFMDESESSMSTWIKGWTNFFKNDLGILNMPTTGLEGSFELSPEQQDWIDDCVEKFCLSKNVINQFKTSK